MKIGVAITTHQRPGLLARMLPHWANHLHGVSVLTVIHDEDGERGIGGGRGVFLHVAVR